MKLERENDLNAFEYLFPKGKEWFSPKEVGAIIGRSDQFVRNIFHCGKLLGHHTTPNGELVSGDEKRVYMRIHKRMIMLYLMETANYDSDFFLESIKGIVAKCSNYELFVLERYIKDLLASPYKRQNRV